MNKKEQDLKEEMIQVGRRLYAAGLSVAKSGNLSCAFASGEILITATGTFLGDLKEEDIVRVNLESGKCLDAKAPSTELPLHLLCHRNFPDKTVIHCHPPLINGYFAVENSLKTLTFETKLFLGDVPVIRQDTPMVSNPQEVVAALQRNNLVALKNHGVVAIGDKFTDALNLVEALEEAVKTAAVARLFNKDSYDALESALKENLTDNQPGYQMFSKEHIQAIVELVNKDAFIAQKGKELDLTVELAIKMDGSDNAYKFNFKEGRIAELGLDAHAPFVISAPPAVWEQVFLGKLDSFVAVTQGKMHLKGELGKLSKWYVPFTRLFALFKQVKIEPRSG
ncbi:MAG: hypothetical protein FJZ13_03445 [Candidatus Omnitrophica bacterium]|nr:hypothetical protein [Candidatus Omnitrophota bacterium]